MTEIVTLDGKYAKPIMSLVLPRLSELPARKATGLFKTKEKRLKVLDFRN